MISLSLFRAVYLSDHWASFLYRCTLHIITVLEDKRSQMIYGICNGFDIVLKGLCS